MKHQKLINIATLIVSAVDLIYIGIAAALGFWFDVVFTALMLVMLLLITWNSNKIEIADYIDKLTHEMHEFVENHEKETEEIPFDISEETANSLNETLDKIRATVEKQNTKDIN